MLIGLFISGVQRSVTHKESKSFPPTQHGGFQPRAALKSDSKRERQRLGKDKGERERVCVCVLYVQPFFFCVRVKFLSLCGQRQFTFHHGKAPSCSPPLPVKPKHLNTVFCLWRVCDSSLDSNVLHVYVRGIRVCERCTRALRPGRGGGGSSGGRRPSIIKGGWKSKVAAPEHTKIPRPRETSVLGHVLLYLPRAGGTVWTLRTVQTRRQVPSQS